MTRIIDFIAAFILLAVLACAQFFLVKRQSPKWQTWLLWSGVSAAYFGGIGLTNSGQSLTQKLIAMGVGAIGGAVGGFIFAPPFMWRAKRLR